MKYISILILAKLMFCGIDEQKKEWEKEYLASQPTYFNRAPIVHKKPMKGVYDPNTWTGLKTSLHEAAFKVAHFYVEIFDFADKNIDDIVGHGELLDIYEHYGWPKFDDYDN